MQYNISELFSIGGYSIGGYLKVSIKIQRALGSNSAILLAYLEDRDQFYKNEDWFSETRNRIQWETGLSHSKQRSAITKLVKSKIIETNLKGCPAQTYYKINHTELASYLQKCEEK